MNRHDDKRIQLLLETLMKLEETASDRDVVTTVQRYCRNRRSVLEFSKARKAARELLRDYGWQRK